MAILLVAGILVVAAGLVAIVMGIPVKEFSLGNTLILAGTVAASAGAVLIGLSMVVRELRNIVRLATPRPKAPDLAASSAAAADSARGEPSLQPSLETAPSAAQDASRADAAA